MRTCSTCLKEKEFEEFRKDRKCKEGRSYQCKPCFTNWTKAYEKTEKGYLMRAYRNMKSRITGVQKTKHHLYQGKSLLSKDAFYEWAKSSSFIQMFNSYVESGYEMKLAPSVDRIDSRRGYELDNIRWITQSENSRRGAYSRYGKEYPNE